ncbi:MAG: MFS transporter [Planctomycetes bacterium]|nr:MFS transporter [Planctomycetota bacterium]
MTEPSAAQTRDACSLSWPQQRRNLVLFATCTGMQYLAAPVLYVGITQASLCDRLGADARTSNLPATLFFAMTAMPAIIAWLSPRVASLKRNLMLCYATSAVMLATLAVTLLLPLPNSVKLAMVILQGGVAGAVMPAAIALLWEAIGRGSDESRRGLALSLAFGLGPILAVVGSFAQTTLLGGDLFGWKFSGAAYPWSFVMLFAAGAPVMAVAAWLSRLFVVPPVDREPQREPLAAVMPLLIGVPVMFASVALMHAAAVTENEAYRQVGYVAAAIAAMSLTYYFRSLLRQRVLLLATVVTILIYAVNGSPSNMNLYSHEALGDAPEQYAGIQNMLRFGCKAIAGGLLGWMLTRTNPRAGILATAAICLASQLWAMLVTGPWYLASFVIFGAGELIGVYAPNYMVSASRTNDLRRTMAFATMLMVPAAPAGYLYGTIVDYVRDNRLTAFGLTSEALGFRLSFLASSLLILVGIVVAVTLLPKKPKQE